MRVTATSIAFTAASVVFGGANAYANPVRFISSFAIGVIVGSIRARVAYDHVMSNERGNRETQKEKHANVRLLCSFLPGKITAITSLFSYVLRHVSKGSQLDYLAGISSPMMLGWSVGIFFYFNKLRSSDKEDVKRPLRMNTL